MKSALVFVRGINESIYSFYMILDNGSQISVITQEARNILGLKQYYVNSLIMDLNRSDIKSKKESESRNFGQRWQFS